MKPVISPSLLSADFYQLGREVASVQSADWLHVDVMDGHFVPRLTFGCPVVDALAANAPLPMDIHLMVSNPLHHVDAFASRLSKELLGGVTFHIEAGNDHEIGACLTALERYPGVRKGLALRPGTDPDRLLPWLERLDLVMVMTVEPGMGGQSFLDRQLPMVEKTRALLERYNPACRLEVDGGIDDKTIALTARAGADAFVAGTYIFRRTDRAQAIGELRGALHA